MAKKYLKKINHFRVLSNGVRNISEKVGAKSWASGLRERKGTAHRPCVS